MKIQYTNAYKKDVKRVLSRGKIPDELAEAIITLGSGDVLPSKFKAHKLAGSELFDAHIKPNPILLYETADDCLILRRLGSHADLFR